MVTTKKKKADDGFAVILTGGKQYLVKKGDVLKVEKLKDIKKDGSVVFDKVLLVADGKSANGGVKIGTPYLDGAKVTAKSEGEIRGKKVTIQKYKAKTRYRVKKGHRQTYTQVTITEIK